MTQQIHKLKVGDLFDGRYELQKIIGIGGFAEVWRAIDVVTGVTKAIKVYASLDDEAFKDLAAEYACMEGINHPGLLHADHFDRWGNMPYLTMKYCGGGSLLHNVGNTNTEQLLDIIHDIADALAYLHDNGMVHQDIKPANILVDFRGEKINYLLSDFGISAKSRNHLTKSVRSNNIDNKVAMTEAYAPPEKFSPKRAERQPHPKGDIFSLGITIYELATGKLPFDNLSTGREMLYNNVQVELSQVHDPVIREFIRRCIDPVRDKRPAASEIGSVLEEISRRPTPPATPGGNKTVYLTDADLKKKSTSSADPKSISRNSNKATVSMSEQDLRGSFGSKGGWFGSLTNGMKLTILGIGIFVVALVVLFVGNKLLNNSKTAAHDTTAAQEAPIVQASDGLVALDKADIDYSMINTHYAEVLNSTILSMDNMRPLIKQAPTFSGMTDSEKSAVREFVKNYNYLTTNCINNAYPPKDVGEDHVKNPKITDKLGRMEVIYDNIKRKYAAEWAEINSR